MLTNRSEIQVRYAATDMMGIAYHGSYLPWLEIGRTNALRENGCVYADLEKAGYRLPVLEVNVQYKKPAFYDDVVVIETEMREKPHLRIRLDYKLTRGGELLATAHTVHAFINHQGEPVRPPQMFVEAAKRWFGQG
jgi:acyl-CoA thioester hydrolase